MNPSNLPTCLSILLALATSASAEIIGVEQFDYSDSTIAAKNGGMFWDYKNFTPIGHNGTPSTWDNVSGAPVATSGRLVTNNSSAKREYNGALESDGAVNDPASVPSSVAHSVYYRVTFTTGATLPSFISISSSDFGTDIVSFGVSMDLPSDNKFSFRIHPLNFISTGPLAAPNTTYTLVAKLDYVNNVASLYLNPDFNAAESAVTPLLTFSNFTPTNWSTAVRLASGTGGAVSWDDLVVATTWDDLGTVVSTATDEDNLSLVPTAGGGTGVSLREAVKYSPSGTLITFAPALSGKTTTLTAGELAPPAARFLTIDASSLPLGITIDGNNTSRLFAIDLGQTLTLRALTLAGGNGVGSGSASPTLGIGGALYNNGSTLRLIGCTLTGNRATEGGAIYSDTNLTTQRTELTRCTIGGNTVTLRGGAVYNIDGRMSLTACTVSGNAAPGGGGAVASYGDTVTPTTLDHTLVSANTGGDVQFVFNTTNSFISQGWNLVGDGNGNGAFTQTGDQTGVTNPMLSPLGNFGGPTMTMHPLIGSPAIETGGATNPGGTDQRGFPRFVDGDDSGSVLLDIGAVECGYPHTVSDAGDAGGPSLRNILNAARFTPGARVRFSPATFPAIITLNGNELAIPAAAGLFIDASNLSGPVTISGSNASRVFNIAAGASVAMHGLIITNGKALDGGNGPGGSGDHGGGISNEGSLSLFSCAITNCRSGQGGSSGDFAGSGGDGGGLFNRGALSLHACSLSGNVTGNGGNGGVSSGRGGAGGGLSNIAFDATVSLTACTITGNQTGAGGNAASGGGGGGISNFGTLRLNACTVANNQAGNGAGPSSFGGDGGGISSRAFGSVLSLASSTVSGNRTGSGGFGDGNGGGLDLGGTVSLRSSTIAGNQAREGGGIRDAAEALLLEHCTVAGNSSTGAGGGIHVPFSSFPLTLRHSIVAGNTAPSGPDLKGGAVIYQNANFIGNPAGPDSTTGPAPLTGNALLAPLGDYGGPTFTMALKPTSPARNAATGSNATTDQRGFPVIGIADLGAYEAGTLTNYNNFIYETLPATASDAQHASTFDFDGDGANNLAEYIAGTVVTNPASVFRITAVAQSPNGFTKSVTFPTVLGRRYQFEFSPDLVSWQIANDLVGDGTPQGFAIGSAQSPLFLRIRVGP